MIKPKANPKVILTFLLFLTLLSGCEKTVEYKYLKGFIMYMDEVHEVNITESADDIIYYVIPVSDCNTCQSTFLNIEMLNSIKVDPKKLVVVLTGIASGDQYNLAVKELNLKYKVLKDPEDKISRYQTGVSKPLLIHLVKDKVAYYLNVTDDQVNTARTYLENL